MSRAPTFEEYAARVENSGTIEERAALAGIKKLKAKDAEQRAVGGIDGIRRETSVVIDPFLKADESDPTVENGMVPRKPTLDELDS